MTKRRVIVNGTAMDVETDPETGRILLRKPSLWQRVRRWFTSLAGGRP